MRFLPDQYRETVSRTANALDWDQVEVVVAALVDLGNRGGRLFVLDLGGGSAGNAGHMTNDIRKLTGIEAYATTDNVSEFTPRINDDGWGNAFAGWLKVSLIGSMFSALSAEVSTIWVMGYPR